jgi:hypothetical protein
MPAIDYRGFIQDSFVLKNKEGQLVPFIFNDVQNLWYDWLLEYYGEELQGIRENDDKGRQFGISTVIAGIFTTDFILSELGEIPVTDSDVYSYKDKETASHFARVNMFLDSFLLKSQGGDYREPEHRRELPNLRKLFIGNDRGNQLIGRRNKTRYATQTASAKTSGRGDTKHNLHWSEVAFYPNTDILNAEDLVTAAEEQVPQGRGKIFRESTGNMMGDFFSREYYLGKNGESDFKSRFLAWYLHKAYRLEAPHDWMPPEYYDPLIAAGQADLDQCYWHWMKTRQLTSKKKLREYPTYDYESFLLAGSGYFDESALLFHKLRIQKPIKESRVVQALLVGGAR